MLSAISILFYLGGWTFLVRSTLKREKLRSRPILAIIALALLTHGIAIYRSIYTSEGYSFGIFNAASLIFWSVNAVVLLSSLRKPLHNLFLLLLPFSIVAILAGLVFDEPTKATTNPGAGLAIHILLSVLAYSIFTIASFHALLLAYQNRKLKLKQPRGVIGLLPPLETMETLLFEFVWAGQILLTLALVTGALFLQDIFAQQLSHKVVFSVLSWLIYGLLLFGRHVLGWGGASAIRWTLGGFAALATAYFGSKFVLELIL